MIRTIPYARPHATRFDARRWLRRECTLRWSAFALVLLPQTQYLSLSNPLCILMFAIGVCLALIWVAWAIAIYIEGLSAVARLRRIVVDAILRRVLIGLTLGAICVSGLITNWPFRLNFWLSEPFLNVAADRVEEGRTPFFFGGFVMTTWEAHAPETVGLYTSRSSDGWVGLVRYPPPPRFTPATPRINSNNGFDKFVSGRWHLVDED